MVTPDALPFEEALEALAMDGFDHPSVIAGPDAWRAALGTPAPRGVFERDHMEAA